MTKKTAILKPEEALVFKGKLRVSGRIYGDEKERFEDGVVVTTSKVVKIETKNTIYFLH